MNNCSTQLLKGEEIFYNIGIAVKVDEKLVDK